MLGYDRGMMTGALHVEEVISRARRASLRRNDRRQRCNLGSTTPQRLQESSAMSGLEASVQQTVRPFIRLAQLFAQPH
jgi:hypothetical protein